MTGAGRSPPLARRLVWFVLLWLSGVATVAAVTLAIRWAMAV